ncbi:Hypothetical predicted protein, partial [Podarcis lilfordi]
MASPPGCTSKARSCWKEQNAVGFTGSSAPRCFKTVEWNVHVSAAARRWQASYSRMRSSIQRMCCPYEFCARAPPFLAATDGSGAWNHCAFLGFTLRFPFRLLGQAEKQTFKLNPLPSPL